MAYTYIVECSDGTLYTGWTTQLKQRMAIHNSGQGAKYTRGRTPVKLVYFEHYEEGKTARSREWAIKQLTRPEKMQLIACFDPALLNELNLHQ
ncbi:GIY-YIG nuclease family protein [bacterium BFN5]|nr:GIY-YIG nuclease family protein [bacterium BFN5]